MMGVHSPDRALPRPTAEERRHLGKIVLVRHIPCARRCTHIFPNAMSYERKHHNGTPSSALLAGVCPTPPTSNEWPIMATMAGCSGRRNRDKAGYSSCRATPGLRIMFDTGCMSFWSCASLVFSGGESGLEDTSDPTPKS